MTAERDQLTADNKMQKTAEVIKNTDLADTFLMLNKFLYDQEWDKIKFTLKNILSTSSKYPQPFLSELIQYTHSFAQQLISNNESNSAEDIYLLFLVHTEKLLTPEQYCNFLYTAADQYFAAQFYEMALPYYTQILNIIEKSDICQSHKTHIIEKISLIESHVAQQIINKLVEFDKTADRKFILPYKANGFWYQQRQQLKILRNKLEIPTINNLHEINKFNAFLPWHDEFKTFLLTSINTIVTQLGPPPCEFSFILAGSYGRGDSAIYSDIDPCILIQPQTTDEQNEQMRKHPYFDAFIQFLTFHLNSLGDPWIVAKNKKQEFYRIYQGLHLDSCDLLYLAHEDVSHRYLIQTPQSLATWIMQGFYVDVDEFLCISYGLQWTQFLYQSNDKANLYEDYLKALHLEDKAQYARYFIKHHYYQFKKSFNQSWMNLASIDLKMRFICPLIYMCWDITLIKCKQPYQPTHNSILLKSLMAWRELKFLSLNFINYLESSFKFLQALKFEGQRKRNGQPDRFLFPYVNHTKNDYDKSGIPLHYLPQINEEQLHCLIAIDAVLQIQFYCISEIAIQENNAQFDPIKHIIKHALPAKPNRWLPLLASLFAHFFTCPTDYLYYYRFIADKYRQSFLQHLQQQFKEVSLYLPIEAILNRCPNEEGLRPLMLNSQQQWQNQLLMIFNMQSTENEIKEAKRNKQWIVTGSNIDKKDKFKLQHYLLNIEVKQKLFNENGDFKINIKPHTALNFSINNNDFIAQIEPKFPLIESSINYLSWLIAGGGAPENYLCRFQRGKEYVVVEFLATSRTTPKLTAEDFANFDFGRLWHRFFNYVDKLVNFYQLLFPERIKKDHDRIFVPITEQLVIDLWYNSNNLHHSIKHALKINQEISENALLDTVNQKLINYFQSFITQSLINNNLDIHTLISPKQALQVLSRLEKEQVNSITHLIKSGNSDALSQLQYLNSRLQHILIDDIVRTLETAQSLPVNHPWNEQQLHHLLQIMLGISSTKLNLSVFSSILTAQLFIKLLQNTGYNITELNISDCKQINQELVNSIADYCPKLQSLIINQWPSVNFTLSDSFIYLRKVEINNCTHLQIMKIHAPKLQSLRAQNNASLTTLQLDTKCLKELNLTKCSMLPEETLIGCLPSTKALEKVILKGCKKIHYIQFREKHPYLLRQSFNKHKGKFKENLKIDYIVYRKRLATIYHSMKKRFFPSFEEKKVSRNNQ